MAFKFKQFAIEHDRCAMKVNTDGILLGAWCELPAQGNVLDIGTGSGLIALMLAQRNPALTICGIEIDEASAQQAKGNFSASPFSSQLALVQQDLNDYQPQARFSLIVSNPPYFDNDLLSDDARRRQARHHQSLNFEQLFDFAVAHLTEEGCLALVLPDSALDNVMRVAADARMFLLSRLQVRARSSKAPYLSLLRFGFSPPVQRRDSELVIYQDGREYTEEYKALTSAFYLKH